MLLVKFKSNFEDCFWIHVFVMKEPIFHSLSELFLKVILGRKKLKTIRSCFFIIKGGKERIKAREELKDCFILGGGGWNVSKC